MIFLPTTSRSFVAVAAEADRATGKQVTLCQDGRPQLPVAAGDHVEVGADLAAMLRRITGGEFELTEADDRPAIRLALTKDFPRNRWLELKELGPEGFALQTDGHSLHLVANTPLGLQHATATLLHELGYRQFFPGEVWEVVPRRPTLKVALNMRDSPSFPTQRRIWYGFGAYGPCKADWEQWVRRNRMGGPLAVSIGHTWHGLRAERDFDQHPEWFALVDGKRQPTKPCYSHPAVLEKAKAAALVRAGQGAQMISMSPPDGLGYCECERCLAAAGVEESFEEKGSLFGRTAQGKVVNVTSETVFKLASDVAAAVAEEHSDVLIGCYAYSAYSHPPSFKLHPNVYLQTTTAYRRTPLTLEEQLAQFGKQATQLGIREYYSVYQWDWDYPDPGKMTPEQLQTDLQFFHRCGVTAVNAEASNNWAPRGLGYYVDSRLLWDVAADPRLIVRDFYEQAFGPAALPMQRYFTRWYGESAAALSTGEPLPRRTKFFDKGMHNPAVLLAAMDNLDTATKLAADRPDVLARIDHLRMYLHYLALRVRLEQAVATGDAGAIHAAIETETRFGGRLTYTNMIHTRPLLGKAFLRRFRKQADLLADIPDAQSHGKGWRAIGTPPDREELDRLWQADRAWLRDHLK